MAFFNKKKKERKKEKQARVTPCSWSVGLIGH
jgi:hypothetical protein